MSATQPIDQEELQPVPQRPPEGEIVSNQQLYLAQIAQYRNTIAFGGQRNPSNIWVSMVRDDSSALLYYRELEEKDEDVANALDTLKLAVLERDRSIEPADDSALASEIRDFIEDQIEALPNFHQALDCLLDAPGYGFSVAEMIFDVSEGQVALTDIHDCPQELFLFGPRFQPQIGQLQFLDSPYAMTGTPVPEEKFITWSYRVRGRSRVGRPLLRSVFWPSWFKRNVQRLWLQYAEKGPGTAVVRYQDGNNASERAQAAALALALVEEAAVAVPMNFQYDAELLKIARALDPAVHKELYTLMQYSITRRIMGETLTSFGNEGGTGAKAQGEVHADTLNRKAVELSRALASVINRQLIRPLVLWNYGPDAPMPEWSFDITESEDLAERVTVDSSLQKMGKQYTAGYISERYDVPLAEGEDPATVMKPAAPAPALNLMTPAGTPLKPNFAEPEAEARFQHDQAQFDQLFAQLKDEAASLYGERVREIVNAAKAARS